MNKAKIQNIIIALAMMSAISACAPAPSQGFVSSGVYNVKDNTEGYRAPDSIFAY